MAIVSELHASNASDRRLYACFLLTCAAGCVTMVIVYNWWSRFEDLLSRSHLVRPGSPSVYRLVPKRRTTTGTWTRITVTDRKPHQSNKTMVLVGETGTGKSTLINAVFNYVQGVTWEDNVWFEIADKDGDTRRQSESQTRTVTVYEMCGGGTVDLCVTVVDTPGYGDTRGVDRDQHITTGFLDLLCSHEGVDGVDLVGVVLKATDNRLSDRLLYVWDSVTSLFGKDLDRNMVALISHSDGMKPEDALRALEDAHVPLSKDQNQEPLYFLFNNRQTTPRQKRTVRHLQSSWQTSTDGLKELMDFMHKREPQNLKTTLEVLQERIRLESCIRKLKEELDGTDAPLNTDESLDQAVDHILHLDQIALNVDSLSTYVHLDFLIQKMKEKGDAEKVQKLEEMEGRINERTKTAMWFACAFTVGLKQ
ncbi:uncharacterized protein LOC115415801 [Sphaeramia orbicularis]|uniref:uncharacterized protein LOC115415801 n=1 Tax=Sphaeramia orbicularis TaxID=375764 RepID=UPI00117CC7DD|nr:uncharacterized protein LOC115415801 [Sphaeramia orbicularis]